jgi:hypothetical protein
LHNQLAEDAQTMSRAAAVLLLNKGATPRRLIFLAFLLSTLFCYAQPKNAALDCLDLLPQEGTFSVKDHRNKCFRDELGFANISAIQNAEKLFGLSPKEIAFVGCDIAPFAARIDRSEPELHFEILYNSTQELSASTVAIFHELGHIYQLKQAGSYEGLLSSAHQDLERVELGADYLAGVAVTRLQMSEKDFDVDLALVGSYTIHSSPHGLPHERSASFNYGVTSGKTDNPLDSIYQKFQDDDYGHIKQRS